MKLKPKADQSSQSAGNRWRVLCVVLNTVWLKYCKDYDMMILRLMDVK